MAGLATEDFHVSIRSWLVSACAVLIGVSFFCVVGGAPAQQTPSAEGTPRRVKVLFLGDTGHHQPIERARDAYSRLGRRGVDLTYTQDLSDLNPDTLGRYDVLLLYANWTRISPAQEKALIDFVEGGHGLAVIHCGSYCFLNSPKITAMIGGRFKSHSTGTFKETIVKPDSVIENGLKPIESWDETYVHEMHNEKDREVLSYRVEGDKREPYTWTRTQGKGRVFYTAWGHDQRTWTNPDFDALLERGIRHKDLHRLIARLGDYGRWPLSEATLATTTDPLPRLVLREDEGDWCLTARGWQRPATPTAVREVRMRLKRSA